MILLVAIISSIISYTSYSDTVQQNLEESMEFAVQMLRDDATKYYSTTTNGYAVEQESIDLSPEEKNALLKKNFIKYLGQNLSKEGNITRLDVNIYGADAVNGLLSAEVIATFKYPTGNEGTVTCYRTVLLDKFLKNKTE